jgi:hypothetical protein
MTTTSTPPHDTTSVLPSEEHWADEVAARLRLLQAAGADEPVEQREAHIEDQVKRSLQSVPAAQRARYLERLTARFPTGQVTVIAAPSNGAADRKPQTPEELALIVGEAWGRFTPEQKKQFRERLAALGLAELATAAPTAAAVPAPAADAGDFSEAKRIFGLAPNENIVPLRLGRLAAIETDFFAKLDTLAWSTWKQVAPQSSLKKENTGDLRSQLKRYLKGDAEPGDQQMAQQIERTRQLVSSLVGALAVTSRGFVKRYQTRYSPDAVKDIVRMEGGIGPFGGDAKCWKKYSELAGEITELSIHAEMMEAVARFVEEMTKQKKTATPFQA